MKKDSFGIYILIYFSVALFLVGHVFVLNYLIDPWWHFDGNKIGTKYTFDEKAAKLNRLTYDFKRGARYDCVILGSSRLLTFNPHSIPNHSCFNLSSSSAHFPRMLAHASYYKELFGEAKLVLVGIDDWHFSTELPTVKPIRMAKPTTSWTSTYFGLDAFRFSGRIANKYGVLIGYDSDWSPTVTGRGETDYTRNKKWQAARKGYASARKDAFYASNAEWLPLFKELFPSATVVGFVTTLAPDYIAQIDAKWGMSNFATVMHSASENFDVFKDFTYPNDLSKNFKATWDGNHFKPYHTEYLVRSLILNERGFGLNVKALDRESYIALYEGVLPEILKEGLPDIYLAKYKSADSEIVTEKQSEVS